MPFHVKLNGEINRTFKEHFVANRFKKRLALENPEATVTIEVEE